MSTTNKHQAHGIIVQFDLDGMPTWTAIDQISRFEGLGMTVDSKKATTHDSGAWEEYLPGKTVDPGTVTLGLIWDPDASTSAQNWLETNIGVADKDFKVTFPSTDSQVYTFSGFVKEFGPAEADQDGLLIRQAVIQISGAITRAA